MAKFSIPAARRLVERVASEVLGVNVRLDGDIWLAENYESERGSVVHLSITLDRREVSIHSRFACAVQPDLPNGASISDNGKWNHYMPLDEGAESVEMFLRLILAELRPIPATRADRPCIWADYYRPDWHRYLAEKRASEGGC